MSCDSPRQWHIWNSGAHQAWAAVCVECASEMVDLSDFLPDGEEAVTPAPEEGGA